MIPAGTLVKIHGHHSAPGKGLSYFGRIGTLAEPCNGEGWDVVDLTDGTSVYSFSISKTTRNARKELP